MKYGLLTFKDPVPDTSRKILHVDMDAFYASIEARDNPAIANKPIIIAKHPRLTGGRGIVSTCNYIARQYGIHSAMSSQVAYKLCPRGTFVEGNMRYYMSISQEIRQIFLSYTDLVEPLSLDEAYLDVTQNKKGIKSATILAKMIQQEILDRLGLTCSVGVSYNKFIAKVASDFKKPSGLTVVTPSDAPQFLKQLQLTQFYGVGKKFAATLNEHGIVTGEDVLPLELDELVSRYGKAGYSLYFKVRGIHDSPVVVGRERKQVGRERTYSPFLESNEEVAIHLQKLSEKVMARIQQKNLKPHTLTLKIRTESFDTKSRQIQVAQPIVTVARCYQMAYQLWERHGDLTTSIRLLGISVSNFEEAPHYEELKLC